MKYKNVETRTVNLSSCGLTDGDIPDLLVYLNRYVNLESLDLSNNDLTTIPKIKSSTLSILRLAGNKIKKLFPVFSDLPNLKILDLSRNRLKIVPDVFRPLTNLRFLYLQRNQILKVMDVFRLPNLEALYLNYNLLNEFPPSLLTNRTLTYLEISHNYIQTAPTVPFTVCLSASLPVKTVRFIDD